MKNRAVTPNRKWDDGERFAFATQKLRATTIPARRLDGPAADEWDWDTDTQGGSPMNHTTTCTECGRVFDLTDTDDAAEWTFGHDCEDC